MNEYDIFMTFLTLLTNIFILSIYIITTPLQGENHRVASLIGCVVSREYRHNRSSRLSVATLAVLNEFETQL